MKCCLLYSLPINKPFPNANFWAQVEKKKSLLFGIHRLLPPYLFIPVFSRISNQSILKEISPEYSLEGLMLKLKFQYSGHLMQRANSSEKTLILGKVVAGGERGDRGWDGWMAWPIQWTWVWADSRRRWRMEKPGVLQSMGLQRVRHDWATEQQQQVLNETQLPWAPRPSLRFISV